jgi:hypothetical protein
MPSLRARALTRSLVELIERAVEEYAQSKEK